MNTLDQRSEKHKCCIYSDGMSVKKNLTFSEYFWFVCADGLLNRSSMSLINILILHYNSCVSFSFSAKVTGTLM